MSETDSPKVGPGWRERTRIIIFEADTPAGKAFDVALLISIGVSVCAVVLESVPSIEAHFGFALRVVEWFLTVVFTAEYIVRLACVTRPLRYATSFFGIVDLLSILPTYMSLLVPGSQSLLVIRSLRLLRVFRVLKLVRYLREANELLYAIRNGGRKVMVFLGTIIVLVSILGSMMFIVEGAENGFTSIPTSMYWAVVTMTTVGYGDLVPKTVVGKGIASLVMIIGYCIIAIPTGIVTAEMMAVGRKGITTRQCPECLTEGHERHAKFCKDCAAPLPPASI
jgi:voltage-gated potassium channel